MRSRIVLTKIAPLILGTWYSVITPVSAQASQPTTPAETSTLAQATPYLLEDRSIRNSQSIGDPLYSPDDRYDYGSNVPGLYRELNEDIYGYSLYVFPNGQFAVWHDCHCASPAYFMYLGHWHRERNVISFKVEEKSSRKGCAADFNEFTTRFGDLSKVDVLMTVPDSRPGTIVLAPEATLMKAPMDRLFLRDEPLRHWKTELVRAQAEFSKPRSAP